MSDDAPQQTGSGSFYGWLWRALPGPWPARLAALVALAAVVVAVLFLLVFPWLEPRLPFNQVTVGQAVPAAQPGGGGWPV